MGFRETLNESEEELVPAAMQIIGDGIDWSTFCNTLNVTGDEARRLLHEMGHRHLAGFAGGLVTPSIDVVRNRRLAHRMDLASAEGGVGIPGGAAGVQVEAEAEADLSLG